MKTRIIVLVAVIAALHIGASLFVRPVSTVVANKVSVATLNGGDAEFVTNETVQNGLSLPWLLVGDLVAGALILGPAFRRKSTNQN